MVITNDDKEECKHKRYDFNFTANEFRDVTNNKKMLNHPLNKIVSIRHNLYTKVTDKKTLYNFCGKRHTMADEINNYALRHKDIFKNKKNKKIL